MKDILIRSGEPDLKRRSFLKTGVLTLGAIALNSGTVLSQGSSSNWTHFRSGPKRSGSSSLGSPPEPETVRWTLGLGDTTLSPIAIDDAIFVGDKNGNLLRVDRKSGSVAWNTEISAPVQYAPSFANDTVYAGTTDGAIHALDAASGESQWSQQLEGTALPPVVFDGRVFITTVVRSNDTFFRMYAFEADGGELIWRLKRSSRFNVDDALPLHWPIPAIFQETVIANFSWNGGSDGVGLIGAYGQQTGDVTWETYINDTITNVSAPAVGESSIYSVKSDNQTLVNMSPSTGGISWETPTHDGTLPSVTAIGDEVIVSIEESAYRSPGYKAFDPTTGSEEWVVQADGAGSMVTTTGKEFYFVTGGVLTAVDAASGLSNWQYELGEEVEGVGYKGMEPIPMPHGMLVQYGGTLYMLGDGSIEAENDQKKTTTDSSGLSDPETQPNGEETVKYSTKSAQTNSGKSGVSSTTQIDGSSTGGESTGQVSLVDSATVTLISNIVYIIGAVTSGLYALIRGKRKFRGD